MLRFVSFAAAVVFCVLAAGCGTIGPCGGKCAMMNKNVPAMCSKCGGPFCPLCGQAMMGTTAPAVAVPPVAGVAPQSAPSVQPVPVVPAAVAEGLPSRGVPVKDKFSTIPVEKATGAIKADGVLNEAAWDKAASVGDFIEGPGRKPEVDTKWLVTYDDNNLYMAVLCSEPNTDKLVAKATTRDGNVWGDDSVEIYVDPEHQKIKAYFAFFINSKNVVYDRTADPNWSGDWSSATSIVPGKGWIVETAIPWKTMGLKPTAGHKLGMLVARGRQAGLGKGQSLFVVGCRGEAKDTTAYPVFELK